MLAEPKIKTELKTEEGYNADIWGYMSAQCPHYVRTTSHEGYMSFSSRNYADIVRTSPGINVRTGYSRTFLTNYTATDGQNDV